MGTRKKIMAFVFQLLTLAAIQLGCPLRIWHIERKKHYDQFYG